MIGWQNDGQGWAEAAGIGRGRVFRSLDRWEHIADNRSEASVSWAAKEQPCQASSFLSIFSG